METLRSLIEDSAASIIGGVRFGQDRLLGSQNPDIALDDIHIDPSSVILPDYEVAVKSRATHKEPESDEHGTYYQEKVRYTDGAVRLVTIGVPHAPLSDHPVVSADPWMTGPDGLNKIEIQQLVQCGLNVVWNHHHGRHATLPTNKDRLTTMLHFLSSKSIGKSAAHDHALLDDLARTAKFNTQQVNRKGYSRSSMSGEAFIAQGVRLPTPREVFWSDLEAHCFATGVSVRGLAKLLAKQIPHEIAAAKEIIDSTLAEKPINPDGRTPSLREYAKTVDVHPLNLTHEAAWIGLFISGEAGLYGKAVPLDAKGVRTIYKHDYMSQQADQKRMHAERKNIAILERPGAHLSAASPEMLREKFERYKRLALYSFEHEDDMSELQVTDITELDEPKLVAA